MNEQEHDQLWDLLGKAKRPAVSPFFSRNVLRAVREEQAVRRSPFAWLRLGWRMVALTSATAAVMVLSLAGVLHVKKANKQQPTIAQQIVDNPDYEVIRDLDDLLAHEESSLWLDDSVN